MLMINFFCRKMEDYLEFQCHLEIHREIFMKERGVAYKYIVASGKKNKYENLYGLPSPTVGVRNRYLEFSGNYNWLFVDFYA